MTDGVKLPVGWSLTSLGEIRSDQARSINPERSPGEVFELYSVPSFPAGRPDVLPAEAIRSNKQTVDPGTVLLCKINPRINRAWIVGDNSPYRKIASTEWIPFFPLDGIEPAYLRYYLSSNSVRDYLAANASGVGGSLMRVNHRTIANYPFPVAPPTEQKRIVAAIEEQFSRLDAGVAALERVRQNLKRMRAAVLQAATDDAVLRSPQGSVQLLDLLTTPLANGRSVPDGPIDGFPVLRLTAVRGGWIDTRQVKAGSWTAREAAPFTIKAGDFLIVRGNGSKHLVGRGGLVFTSANVAYPDTLIRARLNTGLAIPAFVALLWDSGSVRKQIESAARTTAGIYKINQQSLGQVCLPIPALEDQERILGVAEKHLSMLTSAEATLTSATTRTPPSLLHPRCRLLRQTRPPGPERRTSLRPPGTHRRRTGAHERPESLSCTPTSVAAYYAHAARISCQASGNL